jgi:MFS family permease
MNKKSKTNWQKNSTVFMWNSIFNWYQGFVSVWPLIWLRYMSFSQAMSIYSVSLLIGLVLELPSGALADMIGRRKTVLVGRLFAIASYITYFYARSFPMFLLANILYQLNWTMESGAQSALLYDSLKENKQEKKWYQHIESKTYMYCTMIMVLGCVVGGYAYQIQPHLPYAICIVAAVISFGIAWFFEEPHIDSEKWSLPSYIRQNVEGVKHVVRFSAIRWITLFTVAAGFVSYTGLWYMYEPRLAVEGFSPSILGYVVAGTYLARAVGISLIPAFLKKFGESKTLVLFVLLQSFGSALSIFSGKMWAISSVYLRKAMDGVRKPICDRLANDHVDSKYRATALSAISLYTNLAVALAGPVIGWSE